MVEAWIPVAGGAVLLVAALIAWFARTETPSEEHPPGRAYPTAKGEWVQSKGEQRIANALADMGIAYTYEPEVAGGLRPDFAIDGTDVIVEYWGMAGQAGYEERMVEKMEAYEEHGLDVVGLFPVHVGEMDDVLERELAERGIVGN